MRRVQDISKKQFGRLTAMAYYREGLYVGKWECLCDCGSIVFVLTGNLIQGRTRSCGCLHRDTRTKHGHSSRAATSPEYRSWASMLSRCTNPRNRRYARYGGRGIAVCDRWQDFQNFLADVGARPGPGYSIERVNNDGNYEPGNCRWATTAEQNRNNSNTHFVAFNGKTQCVTDWAIETGLHRNTIFQRLKLGWSVEQTLTAPLHTRHISND